MLLPNKKKQLSRRGWLRVQIVFFVFVFTNLGFHFYEKWISGKPDRFALSSIGLFALSSFSLSCQINIGFEIGFTNFLLATLTTQIMQINEYLVCLPLAICLVIFAVRSYLESRNEETVTSGTKEHVQILAVGWILEKTIPQINPIGFSVVQCELL